jgi:hypothetical protein
LEQELLAPQLAKVAVLALVSAVVLAVELVVLLAVASASVLAVMLAVMLAHQEHIGGTTHSTHYTHSQIHNI